MVITEGSPYPLGVTVYQDSICFSYVSKEEDCGVVLFDKETGRETDRIAFLAEHRTGNVYHMRVTGISAKDTVYCFYEKDKLITDVRAKAFAGEMIVGEKKEQKIRTAAFFNEMYDWGQEAAPRLSYGDSIVYCMHVRGFSKHPSSKVKAPGTYGGIVEKIAYLKELGITTLELQPAYEFDEKDGEKINYWGYKKGYYYVPAQRYSVENPVTEFKDMVKALHKAGMELIMQFYFTEETSKHEIAEILSYWTAVYHVDGFHLKGANIDAGMLAEEPALSEAKLWYYDFPIKKSTGRERLASYTEYYRHDMRRFLKGDAGMVSAVMYRLRCNPGEMGQINYLTNYDGMTLWDTVSYNKKHNEANGEDNRDGTEDNASWNCGEEGENRKRTVQKLRIRQVKNGLLLLFLSQATPLIFMGDEFGNSQKGNNNPYCQDNEITWLDWTQKKRSAGKEIFSFTKQVIALRKAHRVFCSGRELQPADYAAYGCPEISYHGKEAWKPETMSESRQFGVLYCGEYAKDENGKADDWFYIAYNLHWEEKTFALPKLPKGLHWVQEDTVKTESIYSDSQKCIRLPGRCICVYRSIGKKKEGLHESRTAF